MQEQIAADDPFFGVVAEHHAVDTCKIAVAVERPGPTFTARRSHFADRLAHALGAVLGLRVRRQPVRRSVAIGRLGNPRERRQKLGHLLRIPSTLGRVRGAQRVGLQFVVSSKLQEQDAGAGLGEIGKRPYLRDKDAADEHAELSAHPARVLLSRMACGDVPDLVPEHAHELRFVVEIRQDAACDVDVPAGKRKGVDRGRIDNGKAPGQIRPLRAFREAHPELLHVPLQGVVFVQAHFLAHLRVELAAHADFLRFAHQREFALARHRVGRAGSRQDDRKENRWKFHDAPGS